MREKDEHLKVQGQKVQKLKAYIVDNFKKQEAASKAAVPSIVQESTMSVGPGPAFDEDGSIVDGSLSAEGGGGAGVEGMSELQMLRFQLDQLDKEGSQGQQRHRQGDQGGLFEQGEHGGQGPRGQAAPHRGAAAAQPGRAEEGLHTADQRPHARAQGEQGKRAAPGAATR